MRVGQPRSVHVEEVRVNNFAVSIGNRRRLDLCVSAKAENRNISIDGECEAAVEYGAILDFSYLMNRSNAVVIAALFDSMLAAQHVEDDRRVGLVGEWGRDGGKGEGWRYRLGNWRVLGNGDGHCALIWWSGGTGRRTWRASRFEWNARIFVEREGFGHWVDGVWCGDVHENGKCFGLGEELSASWTVGELLWCESEKANFFD